ncbi:MAG: hypothetical protein EBY17_23795 [Acidobacteriia bacterium]|nr:hypothetical protein [Terriglobia bacterium]
MAGAIGLLGVVRRRRAQALTSEGTRAGTEAQGPDTRPWP